jgi:hypothetical protein
MEEMRLVLPKRRRGKLLPLEVFSVKVMVACRWSVHALYVFDHLTFACLLSNFVSPYLTSFLNPLTFA